MNRVCEWTLTSFVIYLLSAISAVLMGTQLKPGIKLSSHRSTVPQINILHHPITVLL